MFRFKAWRGQNLHTRGGDPEHSPRPPGKSDMFPDFRIGALVRTLCFPWGWGTLV